MVGGKEAGQLITDHPDIKAVSLIGSTEVAKAVYARGAARGKRLQCMGGADHGVILPDADLGQAVDILPEPLVLRANESWPCR